MKLNSMIYPALLTGLLLTLLFSCKKLTETVVPTVTITEVTDIMATTATCGGEVTSDGGALVTDRGVCWSINENPTTADFKLSDGADLGTFSSFITALTSDKTYYIRAYAVNAAGTAYSSQLTFTTLVSDIDGNVYHTVTIGTQEWMVENLKVTHYRNGDLIPTYPSWFLLSTAAYCNYGSYEPEPPTIYGRLYNWYAVNDSRKIAPTGWHVPSDAEWHTLVSYLDPSARIPGDDSNIESLTAAAKLKETGTIHWQSPNEDANNETGFTALPGGDLNTGLIFLGVGKWAKFWSSSECLPDDAWHRLIYSGDSRVFRVHYPKWTGESVRCLRD